jgi:hypothetical protein
LCADNKNKKVEFYIREITKSSNKKVYGPYLGYMKKLDKLIKLKGRVIRYKPIAKLNKKVVKLNNQMGGFVVGDLVRTTNPILIEDLQRDHKQNIFKIKKISDTSSIIIITHIDDYDDHKIIFLPSEQLKKIDAASATSAASAASASSAPAVNNANIWNELFDHIVQNEENNNEWFIMRNPDGKYVKVKENGTKKYIKVNKKGRKSKNNWEVLNSNNNWEALNSNNNWDVLKSKNK